jgi:tRNA modification GTPase
LTEDDEKLFEVVKDMNVIVIVNKTDLPQKIDLNKVKELASEHPLVTTSLLNEQGIDDLESAISSLFFTTGIETQDATYVSNTRHVALLSQAKSAIDEAINGVESGIPVDMVQIDLTRAWETLGEITGDTVHESLLDQLFSQFCLGK